MLNSIAKAEMETLITTNRTDAKTNKKQLKICRKIITPEKSKTAT